MIIATLCSLYAVQLTTIYNHKFSFQFEFLAHFQNRGEQLGVKNNKLVMDIIIGFKKTNKP